ncbi:hypothetical protein [Gluconobacter sp. P5B12]|nr:hypothetical protein [Gluconobacter sp. P5B12]
MPEPVCRRKGWCPRLTPAGPTLTRRPCPASQALTPEGTVEET